MKYIFNDEGKEIEVQPERWVWGVVYDDGTELRQFEELESEGGPVGKFHRVGEIDQDRVTMAVLYKFDDPSKRIDIPWEKGMRIIHKYRSIVFDYLGDGRREVRVYMFGFKHGSETSIMFVLPDDRIVWSRDDNYDVTKHNI